MIDGNAIRPRQIFRIPYERAADMSISRHARDCCRIFGVPYQACVPAGYRPEVRRLTASGMPIGCLNQTWSGPVLVWYPEGDWIYTKETSDER